MATTYCLELDDHEFGQVLDGLEQRAVVWERTADYLRTEKFPDGEFFLIEECSDATEADAIAVRYRAILRKLHAQLEAQR